MVAALREVGMKERKFKQTFSAKTDEDVDIFLEKFDRFCDINNKDEDYKLQHLPLQLNSRAYKLYNDLPDDVKQNYVMLCHQMKQYFSPTKLPPLQAFEKLYQLKMTETEKVQDFFEKITNMSKNLGITAPQKTALFINGLPKNIKNYVVDQRPDSLPDALTKAKEGELLNLEDDEQTQLLRILLNKMELKTPAKVTIVDREIPNQTLICGFCTSKNHCIQNCPIYI